MVGQSSGIAKEASRLWGPALQLSDPLIPRRRALLSQAHLLHSCVLPGQVAAATSLSFLGNLLVTSSCVPRSLYPTLGLLVSSKPFISGDHNLQIT